MKIFLVEEFDWRSRGSGWCNYIVSAENMVDAIMKVKKSTFPTGTIPNNYTYEVKEIFIDEPYLVFDSTD